MDYTDKKEYGFENSDRSQCELSWTKRKTKFCWMMGERSIYYWQDGNKRMILILNWDSVDIQTRVETLERR